MRKNAKDCKRHLHSIQALNDALKAQGIDPVKYRQESVQVEEDIGEQDEQSESESE